MTKVCNKCNKEQPLTEFYNYFANKDGKCNYCKTCAAVAQRKRIAKRAVRTEAEKLDKFWNHNINPITGFVCNERQEPKGHNYAYRFGALTKVNV